MLSIIMIFSSCWCLVCGIILLLAPRNSKPNSGSSDVNKISEDLDRKLTEYKKCREDEFRSLSRDFARNPRSFCEKTKVAINIWQTNIISIDEEILHLLKIFNNGLISDTPKTLFNDFRVVFINWPHILTAHLL